MRAENNQEHLYQLEPGEPVLVGELSQETNLALANIGWYLSQMQLNDDISLCSWPGQSEDGRKHEADLGGHPMPWENASDAKVRLAAEVVQERVEMMKRAYKAGYLNVTPSNPQQVALCEPIKALLKHVLENEMNGEPDKQTELLVRWAQNYNVALMRVDWYEERSVEQREVTEEKLLGWALDMAAQQTPPTDDPMMAAAQSEMIAQQTDAELMMLLLDESREAELTAMLMQYDPDMNARTAKRCIHRMRMGEPGIYFAPYVKCKRPVWRARLVGVHCLCPVLTEDVQNAPWVDEIHWLDRHQIMARSDAEDWDPEWVRQVLLLPGMSVSGQTIERFPWAFRGAGLGFGMTAVDARTSGKYQIIERFHTRPTEAGPNCTFRTVFHPLVAGVDGTLVAKHEVWSELDGWYPFVELKKDHNSTYLLGGQGVPEEIQAWQNSLKHQIDARDDHTDLIKRPVILGTAQKMTGTAPGSRLPIGPWAQVPVGRNDKLEYLTPNALGPNETAIESDIDMRVARQMGRSHESVPVDVSQNKQAYLVEGFFAALTRILQMTFRYMQKNMDAVDGLMVTGYPIPLHLTRRDIEGKFNFTLHYDVRDLDNEFVAKKFQLFSTLKTMDTENEMGSPVSYLFRAADPVAAQMLLRNPAVQSTSEEDDEVKGMGAIWGGTMPPAKMGLNFGARWNAFNNQITASALLSQLMNAPDEALNAADLQRKRRFMQRADFLKQQVTQNTLNVERGKLGTDYDHPGQMPQFAPSAIPDVSPVGA